MNNSNVALYVLLSTALTPSALALQTDAPKNTPQTSKVRQVFTSKKFWGAVATVGVIATGGGSLWFINKLLLAKKMQNTGDDLMKYFQQNQEIVKQYVILLYNGEKMINKWGSKDRDYTQPHILDTIKLLAQRGSYRVELYIYSELENSSEVLFKAKTQQLVNDIRRKYEKDFIYTLDTSKAHQSKK